MLEITPAVNKIELVPVKFQCDKSLGDIPAPLPSSCFFMILCGKPASGKSTLCSNLLTKKDIYRKKFDNVYLIMPKNSLGSLPATHPFRKHNEASPEKCFSDLTGEILFKILNECKRSADAGETSLIMCDDMLHAYKNTDVVDQLKELASNRRHYKTSTMI